MRFDEKVVFVTGASGSIGSVTSKLFAREGASVVLIGRNEDKLKKIAEEIKSSGRGEALPVKADITDEEEVQAAVEIAKNEFGRIDILINNAGITNDPVEFHLIHDETWNDLININMIGTFRVTRAILPLMMEQRSGSIVNISAVAGIKAIEKVPLAVYNATKAGVIMFTKSIAIEYAKYNIRSNCVCPGTVRSEFLEPYLADENAREALNTAQPLGRIGEPQDVASAIMYLSSAEASWVTGTVLIVDGGITSK